MKYILFLFPLILSVKTQAQTRTFKNPVVDSSLSIFEEPNLEPDIYLINKDYIIFQGKNG